MGHPGLRCDPTHRWHASGLSPIARLSRRSVHAGQRTALDHAQRHLALERHHAVHHGTLSVPGPWEVLVIEDDELDRELVAELLTVRGRGGVRVTEARTLQAGLEALDVRRFDLIMLDTKLPEVTALHALRAVGDKAPLTPILPHPAYISVQTRQSARQRGAKSILVATPVGSRGLAMA